MHAEAAADPMYWPAVQSMHASTLDAGEYFPATHAVHEMAPVLTPVLVMDPAPQSMHAEADADPMY